MATELPSRMLGISLGCRNTREAKMALNSAARHADIVELRLDFMEDYDLNSLLGDKPCPVVVTNRPVREGGLFDGSERDRIKSLLEAIDLGADYIDIEHDAVHLIGDRKQTKLMVSRHDFHVMPNNLNEICSDLVAKGADVIKVVGTAGSVLDNLSVFDILESAHRSTVAIAMGELGLMSRILALRYDACFLTYATPDRGNSVAPGQLPISTMRNVYHVANIDASTKIFGVLSNQQISEELLHTLNVATLKSKINGVWIPFVASGRRCSVTDVIRSFDVLGVAGYVVDESAHKDISELANDSEVIDWDDAANTVIVNDGGLIGEKTLNLQQSFSTITGTDTLLRV